MARGHYTSIGKSGGGGHGGGHGGGRGGHHGGHHGGHRGGHHGGHRGWWGGWGGWGGWGWPSYALTYALPVADDADAFPHWRSPRHFMNRHRRRIHYLLGMDV